MEIEGDDGRREPRKNLFLSAVLGWGDQSAAVRIRDLSATGARLEGQAGPGPGNDMQLSRGQLRGEGTIVWREHGQCGVRFAQPINLQDWLPGRAGGDQHNVDRMIARVRSDRGHEPACPTTAAAEDFRAMLPARLAEEITFVGRMLADLGDDLASETVVLARHSAKLQNLDIATQILGHIATLLVASDPEAAAAKIGMDALRRRLLRQPI